jgi:PAS domain-containing protein
LSLRVRLLAAFCALSVLTLALGAFAVRCVGRSGAMVAAIFDQALISTSCARSAVSEFAAMQAAFAEQRLAADEAGRRALRDRIAELAELLAGDLDIASDRVGSDTVARAAERAAAAVRTWLAAVTATDGGPPAAADPGALKALAGEAAEALDVLVNHVAGEAFRQRQQAQATIAAARTMTLLATLLALAGGGAAALLLSRRIISPVAAASRAAAGIAAGRLDTSVPPGGRDELGTLLRAMERMRDAIRATIEGEKAERRSAEARLLDALEGSTEGVALTDASGRITAANARAEALLPEAAGLLRPGGDWAAAVSAALPAFGGAGGGAAPDLAAALSGPPPAVAEAARTDGRWLRVSRSAARDGGAVSILSDVTGLKAKEAALAETNRRFGAALDNMAQGLALFDADDRLLVANRRALELLRLPPEAAAPGVSWSAMGRAVMRAAGYPEAEAAVLAQDRVRFAARRTAGTRLRETPDGQIIALSLSPTTDGGFVATGRT